jgi:CubicO group peptidase (beta-lactamase class C family)
LLPSYPSAEAREQVTVHHLLTMSSGIPDLFRLPEFWAGLGTIKTLPDFWRYFARSPSSYFLLLGAIMSCGGPHRPTEPTTLGGGKE